MTCVICIAFNARARGDDTAARARDILVKYCVECHGQKRESDPNFDVRDYAYITRARAGLVVPRSPEKSRLLQRIESGEMPADGRRPPTQEEVVILRKWIADGAGPWAGGRRGPVLAGYERKVIELDRESGELGRRYFTLVNLHNAGATDDDLRSARRALSKAVNSLSLDYQITDPLALDPMKLVYAINLHDYAWGAGDWDRIRRAYPYGGERDVMRADWFIANALKPPLYYDTLGIPQSEARFVQGLKASGAVVRAGITDSQVSNFHRVIERRGTEHGAYWKSYNRLAAWDVQRNPLTTDYDYAESFFTLPNGLPGWAVFIKGGRRVNEIPVQAAADPEKLSGSAQIVAGLSCIGCHTTHVQPNVRDVVHGLGPQVDRFYPGQGEIDRLLEFDRATFARASRDNPEPVGEVVARFNRDLTLEVAASEIHADPRALVQAVSTRRELQDMGLRPLTIGRTVSRSVWQSPRNGVVPAVRAAQLIGVTQ